MLSIRPTTLAVLAGMSAGLGATLPAAANTYQITIGAAHPNTQTFVRLLETVFMPEVDRLLAEAGHGDTIAWTTGFGGTIVRFESLLEAAQTGLVDIVVSPNVIRPSELPLNMFTYMAPFGTDNVQAVREIVREIYDTFPAVQEQWARFGQQPIAHYIYDSHNIIATFPIERLEDLDGRRIGAAGVVGNFFTGSGAVAVNGNFTTYYNDIQNGVYEGGTGPITPMYQARLHEVAQHLNIVDFGAQYVVALTMNTARMNSLPEYIQQIILAAAMTYEEELTALEIAETAAAIAAMEEAGVTVHTLPAEERQRWAESLPDLAGEWVARLEAQGLPGREILIHYMDGLRARGIEPSRAWDAAFR